MQNFHTFQIATYLCCYAYRYTSILKGAISCRLIWGTYQRAEKCKRRGYNFLLSLIWMNLSKAQDASLKFSDSYLWVLIHGKPEENRFTQTTTTTTTTQSLILHATLKKIRNWSFRNPLNQALHLLLFSTYLFNKLKTHKSKFIPSLVFLHIHENPNLSSFSFYLAYLRTRCNSFR
jgi:hypothetical protein